MKNLIAIVGILGLTNFVFGADMKTPYYNVKLHNNNPIGYEPVILVSSDYFNKAIKTAYIVEGQHHVYGYKKQKNGYEVVSVIFSLSPYLNYGPSEDNHWFIVEEIACTPSNMKVPEGLKKRAVLKFIEDKAHAQLTKDLGPAATDGAVMY